MGRSIAIKYTVTMLLQDEAGKVYECTPAEWRVRARHGRPSGHGKPTAENLVKYVQGFEASTRKGACNAHLGAQKVLSATILDQESRAIVARYSNGLTLSGDS